ncbi:MAG: 3'-5' exonuclease [Patescibacteria group bacterium]
MRKNNFAFIDIETTGLDVRVHEIIEIGCVVTTPELEVVEKFELKIKPENIENADPVALKVNHYDPEDWADAIDSKKSMQILASKVKDCIIVGQNVSFDIAFLEYNFNKNNIKNPMHYHRLDTISIAWAKLHRRQDITHFSLRELCKEFGIKNENSHTGLADAFATYLLYKKLMEL